MIQFFFDVMLCCWVSDPQASKKCTAFFFKR